jgi:hypothetical protein
MEKSFKLLMPTMPNFISYEGPARPKQEGFSAEKNCIPVSDLSEEEARQYAEEMKAAFIEHWKELKSKADKSV